MLIVHFMSDAILFYLRKNVVSFVYISKLHNLSSLKVVRVCEGLISLFKGDVIQLLIRIVWLYFEL